MAIALTSLGILGCQINPRIDVPSLIRDVDCVAWNASKGKKAYVYSATKRGDGGLKYGFSFTTPGELKQTPKILETIHAKNPLPGEEGKSPWIIICRVPEDVLPLPE
ncbi:MAG: hypothetical protein WA001_03360 [Patescibacteria group bacterium]